MSDSHIYELEDIVWDDFSISDDHLVPRPEIRRNEGSAVQTEIHKKLKREVGMTSGTGSPGAERVGVATEKKSSLSPKIKSEQMLPNGSWSHNPDTFHTYNDLITSLSSEGPSIMRGDFISNNNICTGDPTTTNNCTAADNNFSYSLRDAPQPESDLSFLYSGHENKETDDPLFYDWPEIGNFEDVDQMLRTCDSTFGLGDLPKEDEMCWFPSPTAINGCDADSKSEVRSSYSDSNSIKILSENNESTQPNYGSPAVDAFKRSAGASYTPSSLSPNTTEPSCLSKAYSINKLPASADKMDREKPLKEVNVHVRNMEYQMQSVETNVSLHQFDSSKLPSNTQLPLSKSPQKLYSINCSGVQNQNVVDTKSSDSVSAQKKFINSGNEESFNKNSQLDEKSLEETSFRQLQEVMEQLDLKTKLCIRDSLYRLARSAEQRHGAATMNQFNKADNDSSEVLTAETKHAGLLDIETDTNPIDRSIAHLLFHRPNGSSKTPLSNTQPPHSLIEDVEDLMCHVDFSHAKLPPAGKE
uniref:Protein LNK1 n=2 Tax=Kalanchoe fedtschenkoi TaxID=63787 RepID=A0A7N0VEK2_KALFE